MNTETLTPETVQRLIEAQARLRELGGESTIINPRNEAEIVGLKKFIGETMSAYANEFIGCWVAVRQEYEPLIQTLERIGNRIFSVRSAQRLPQQSAAPAAATAQ